ncbi:MAG: hypothetical protein ABIN94_07025 [Ferruginibacter sp.]
MEAIKQSHLKRTGNKLIITIPDSFAAEEVDVLIWPSEKSSESVKSVLPLSEQLLNWPEMTDEELNLIEEKRKHLNSWK